MSWFDQVQCPSCGAAWDCEAQTTVCRQCYAHHPEAAWHDNPADEWWASYGPKVLVLAIFGVVLASDIWFGTKLVPTLIETASDWLE